MPDGRPAEGRSIPVRPRKWEDVNMLTTMDYQKTVQALKRLRVETGSLACFGCGHEHNCSTQGCAILRNAVAHMEAALERATFTPPNEPLTLEQLLEMDGEPVWVIYDQDAAKTTPGFDPLALWALVEVTKDSVFLTNNLGGRTAYADDQDLEWAGITVYRRPPEGET